MKSYIIAVATVAIFGQCFVASAHPGRLDAKGGHNVKGGGYHYHRGEQAKDKETTATAKEAQSKTTPGLWFIKDPKTSTTK